jgi:hypothetical protein
MNEAGSASLCTSYGPQGLCRVETMQLGAGLVDREVPMGRSALGISALLSRRDLAPQAFPIGMRRSRHWRRIENSGSAMLSQLPCLSV